MKVTKEILQAIDTKEYLNRLQDRIKKGFRDKKSDLYAKTMADFKESINGFRAVEYEVENIESSLAILRGKLEAEITRNTPIIDEHLEHLVDIDIDLKFYSGELFSSMANPPQIRIIYKLELLAKRIAELEQADQEPQTKKTKRLTGAEKYALLKALGFFELDKIEYLKTKNKKQLARIFALILDLNEQTVREYLTYEGQNSNKNPLDKKGVKETVSKLLAEFD